MKSQSDWNGDMELMKTTQALGLIWDHNAADLGTSVSDLCHLKLDGSYIVNSYAACSESLHGTLSHTVYENSNLKQAVNL